jgi:molecular chaperone GrpE
MKQTDAKKKIEKDAKRTKDELSKSSDKAKEYLDQLQRLQAEFINYRQRVEKERQDLIRYAKEELIIKLLDVMDNFERAVDAMKNATDVSSCMQGVDMIFQQLRKVLEDEGLQAIEAKGKVFDPYLHEALAKEESDVDENIIIDEFQKGYKLKAKVIRPPKVKVSGGKKNE